MRRITRRLGGPVGCGGCEAFLYGGVGDVHVGFHQGDGGGGVAALAGVEDALVVVVAFGHEFGAESHGQGDVGGGAFVHGADGGGEACPAAAVHEDAVEGAVDADPFGGVGGVGHLFVEGAGGGQVVF